MPDIEMRDVAGAEGMRVPILSNGHAGHPVAPSMNGYHPGPSINERPPTSDGTNGRAVFDVVRNGFQMSPEAAARPRED